MRGLVGREYFEKISGRISIQVTTPYYTMHQYCTLHQYYTSEDKKFLILSSDLSEQYFILEKLDNIPEEKEAGKLTETEKEHILEPLLMKRPEDEYKLEERKISNPDYQLENVLRDEIYGLRDNMLPEELGQDGIHRLVYIRDIIQMGMRCCRSSSCLVMEG